MAFDGHANFANTTVATAPSPATSGLSLVVAAGTSARLGTAPFNVTLAPANVIPDSTNSEIVRVSAVNTGTDTLTLSGRAQENTTARTVAAGWQVIAAPTAKTLTDLEYAGNQIDNPNDSAWNVTWATSSANSAIVTSNPGTGGTTINLTSSTGSKFPSTFPFPLLVYPTGTTPDSPLAELVTVTGRTTDQLTVTRATSNPRNMVIGDLVSIPLDYEFGATIAAGSTLPNTNWSWSNRGTSTYQELFGAGRLVPQAGAAATTNIRGFTQPLPSDTSWTMYAKVPVASYAANYPFGGLFLVDGGGKVLLFGPNWDAGVYVFYCPSVTGSGTVIGSSYTWRGGAPLYYRITCNSSASWDFAYSPDGISWAVPWAGVNLTASPASTTFTRVGIGMDTQSATAGMACHWMRFRKNANPVT